MKQLSLSGANKTIGLLILIVACLFPVYGQDVPTSQTSTAQTTRDTISEEANSEVLVQVNADSLAVVKSIPPVDPNQTSAKQTASKPYVFPTRRERFNRYLKSTVGPFSLARSAVSAGINQWRDNPEEWEQGASGYGKRYASSFGQTRFSKPLPTAWTLPWGWIPVSREASAKVFFRA